MKIINNISFQFDTPKEALIFYRSFMPEFNDMPLKRSKWDIIRSESNESQIGFQIESEDGTAFRATINSLIQFANIVEKTLHVIKKL